MPGTQIISISPSKGHRSKTKSKARQNKIQNTQQTDGIENKSEFQSESTVLTPVDLQIKHRVKHSDAGRRMKMKALGQPELANMVKYGIQLVS